MILAVGVIAIYYALFGVLLMRSIELVDVVLALLLRVGCGVALAGGAPVAAGLVRGKIPQVRLLSSIGTSQTNV